MKKIYATFLILICFISNTRSQNNCVNFDGSNDDISLTYTPSLEFDINSKFTIEAWFKTTANIFIIWSNHVDVSPFVGYEVAIANGKVMMELNNNYITNGIRVETGTTFNDGNWHHAAWVYKGVPNASSCEIYIDGNFQTLTVNTNNLSLSIASGNEVHIGNRDATTYFAVGNLDEIRVWNRALCSAEIQSRKNCYLNGNEPGLEAYYKFNEGIAAGNNSTVTTLTDLTTNAHTGTLNAFALNGATSNWIASTASVSGNCGIYGGLSVNGSNTVCAGSSTSLSANGANTYTWLPTNSTNTTISASPSVTTVYTVYATTSASCMAATLYTLTVVNCTGIHEISAKENIQIYPNPNNGHFIIKVSDATEIKIINALGQIVNKTSLTQQTHSVEINDLPEGIYFVCGQSEFEKWQKKIVVSK